MSFPETGLPIGTSWWIAMNGGSDYCTSGQNSPNNTTYCTINAAHFYVPNGTYAFTIRWSAVVGVWYTPSPATGNVTVAGANVSQPVVFHTAYIVTFVETGLPTGTYWVLVFSVVQNGLTSSSASFPVANGTYNYSVGQTASWVPTPASGNLTVVGANLTVAITFRTATTYLVTFNESGLATGTAWQVWLGGATAGSGSTTVVFNMTNGTYAFVLIAGPQPTGYVSADSPGNLTVNGSDVTLNVTFIRAPYLLTFLESGLPANTVFSAWVTGLGGLGQAGVGSFALSVVNGNYSYWIPPVWGYLPSFPTGNVTIRGANLTVNVVFVPELYQAAFDETGLNPPANWTVVVDASEELTANTSSISIPLGNGTFSFAVFAPPGYVVAPANGSVAVNGSSTTIYVVFTPTLGFPRYAVTFSETGLPSGSGWTVDVNGVYESGTGMQIVFALQNGSYWFEILGPSNYSAVNYSGSFFVAGANTTVSVQFFDIVQPTYNVRFSESGLPSNTTWTVDLNGTNFSSSGSAITYAEPNGTYGYDVANPVGYQAASASGNVTVAGASVGVPITFNSTGSLRTLYHVTFSETGLPAGTNWSVSLTGSANSTNTSTTASMVFWEANGTYQIAIPEAAGDSANVTSVVTVAGAPAVVNISFAPTRYLVSIFETGLPTGTSWAVKIYNTSGGVPAAGNTTGTEALFALPDGSYIVAVSGPPGYRVTLSQSEVTVAGASPAAVTAAFAAIPPPGASSAVLPLSAIGIVLGVTLLGGLAVGWAGRRYAISRWKSEAERWMDDIHQGSSGPGHRPPP